MNKIVWILFFGCVTWGIIGCSTEKEIRMELNSGWQFRKGIREHGYLLRYPVRYTRIYGQRED